MKALCLCISILACLNGKCAEGNIDSLFQSLNKGEVSISERPLSFSDFNITKDGDTTCYVVGDNIEGMSIAYCQEAAEKYAIDMLQVNGRLYKLYSSPEHDMLLDLKVEEASLYHVRTKDKAYVCMTGEATNHRNANEKIYSFVLLDITDPGKVKIGQLLSYFSSIYSFGDFNNDGELDFIKVKPATRGENGFVAEACNLDGDKIKTGSKKGYSISMNVTNGIATISKSNWFL
ncbi:MAG TPA: hypothetical protein VEB40_09155 [Flavipsychrobacter sp.]|nr:hypothetical protein [Flavipsychrobacter sp.]